MKDSEIIISVRNRLWSIYNEYDWISVWFILKRFSLPIPRSSRRSATASLTSRKSASWRSWTPAQTSSWPPAESTTSASSTSSRPEPWPSDAARRSTSRESQSAPELSSSLASLTWRERSPSRLLSWVIIAFICRPSSRIIFPRVTWPIYPIFGCTKYHFKTSPFFKKAHTAFQYNNNKTFSLFRRGCRGIPEPNLRRRADPDQGPQETHRRLRHLARSQRLLLRRDGEVGARLALRRQARHGEQERRRRRWNRRSGSLHLSRELRYYHRLKVKQPHIFFCA